MFHLMELHDVLYSLMEKLIDTLKDDNDYREIYHSFTKNTIRTYVLNENGDWSIGEMPPRLVYHRSSYLRESDIDRISCMDETEKLSEIMLSHGFIKHTDLIHPEIRSVENLSKKLQLTSLLYCGFWGGGLVSFIERYLGLIPKLDFDSEVFNQCYSEFECYHRSSIDSFISIHPLLSFSSDVDLIEFDDEVKIVRLENSEQIRLASYLPFRLFKREPNAGDLDSIKDIFVRALRSKSPSLRGRTKVYQ